MPGPGKRVPSTAETSPALSMPWAMRPPKGVALAASSSRWTGLVSMLTAENRRMSASVIVLASDALCPTCKSSKW